ncbi:MAG: PAC2 family protein [Anaerolineae bacterium]|nr:PAC2 family protein [Anaerolineae bacterium]
MSQGFEIWSKPPAAKFMIAGWSQWADAGAVSSGLPMYLLEQTQADKIAEIDGDGFYLFQIPGTHDLLRPVIELNDGYRQNMELKYNEFFYAGDEDEGFVIFMGEEPHLEEQRYADTFFDVAAALGIQRIAAVAGVYGAMPYDKDREISSVYSHPSMREELDRYAVRFSNYEGGATISMYMADQAERRGIEFFRFCSFVPSYDLGQATIAIGEDYKAWYDIMVRLKHMFRLKLDLTELRHKSDELIAEWDAKIEQVAESMPQLGVHAYMDQLRADFKEMPFEPLSDVWTDELRDLLNNF